MRKTLQHIALLLVIIALGLWLAKGANTGWTKNSVAVEIVDEVTGIEGVENREQFVPGLDFLGLATLSAALLAGISLFLNKKSVP